VVASRLCLVSASPRHDLEIDRGPPLSDTTLVAEYGGNSSAFEVGSEAYKLRDVCAPG
jgi:hypothetical protein